MRGMADRPKGRPAAERSFFKGHGLGNDYLVFLQGKEWRLDPGAVRTVCDRWRGVGSDGVVVVLGSEPEDEAPYRLRMFNPDGSEFERSGNGLRVFGAWLAATGRASVPGGPIPVEVGGDRVSLRIRGGEGPGAYDVEVEMGRAVFGAEAVDLDPGALDAEGRLGHPRFGPLAVEPVSVGNPHCVLFRDPLTREELAELGPFLSGHPAFRNGANVQLARVTGPSELELLIWERGVGETSASGTSSCAAAAAAVRRGLLAPGEIRVRMPGGTLRVEVEEDLDLRLGGPVRTVCHGALDDAFLEGLEEEGKRAGRAGSREADGREK